MADLQLIGPRPVSTPNGLKWAGGRARGLPEDILRAASVRLGVMSLLAAALWFLGVGLGHIADGAMRPGIDTWRIDVPDVIGAIVITLSVALFYYTRRSKRNPCFILDLGLGYMVFMSLALAVMIHKQGATAGFMISPTISWVGVVVLMFAAIVPSTPTKTLVASLVATSMNPLAMMLADVLGGAGFGKAAGDAALMHYPDFLLAGVAVVISHVVTRLGQQVTKAREMGSYQLGELLGRGGMGEVYKATHRMLARPAAIKLIRPEMLGAADDETAKLAIARFKREADAAAHLRSPHTVELYDFGVTEDGTLYLVMEFLEGMDLQSLVSKCGPLPVGRVIHILGQVCDSLDEAHSIGLVHRDIKPANIHIGRVGRHHDFVKVLDFGLVKAVAEVNVDDSMATVPGQMALGTPSYMSPEMALGEGVDPRADIYALGCVAYYLLTGQAVFEAESAFQLIAKHLQSAPMPPSQRTDRPIPPALDSLVLKCLAKDKEGRPQSASELATALSFIPADAWSEQQAMEWWRDAPAPVAIPPGSGYPALTAAPLASI